MSDRMKRFRKAGGLELKPNRPPETDSTHKRKRGLMEWVKRAFSYQRHTGTVGVATVPYITDRPVEGGGREVCAFLVTLPRWVLEKEVLEAMNLGFAFLGEESTKTIQKD